MGNECYSRLQQMISKFPYLHQFFDDSFIERQCESGLTCYIVRGLVSPIDGWTVQESEQHLPSLESRLSKLATINGYDRLKHLLRGASDWNSYQDVLAQIDITHWFKEKSLVKEIEPKLPNNEGYSDILLSFAQQDIYCEAHSFQSILKSLQSQVLEIEKKGDGLKEIKKAVRHLLKETKKQLPQDYPGILALDATKSDKFSDDVRFIAERLLPQRLQVAFIALWSYEGDGDPSWDMIPNDFFVNSKSEFREIGEALLNHLRLNGRITVI